MRVPAPLRTALERLTWFLVLACPSALAGQLGSTSQGVPPGVLALPSEISGPFNVMLFVLDDLGIEQLALYDDLNAWSPGYPYAHTPNIDALAAEGVTFTSFQAAPSCSPFRASVLTGQRVHEHRIGWVVNAGASAHLGHTDGKLLTTLLTESPVPVAVAAVGKWHLGPGDEEPAHPFDVGRFGTYSGKLENPNVGPPVNGALQNWMNYRYTDIADNGAMTQVDVNGGPHLQLVEYQAMRQLAAARAAGSPFFSYNSFHFAHGPYNGTWLDPVLDIDPVSGGPYHSYGEEPEGWIEGVALVRMMTESADTMIGGVLAQLTPEQRARTVVIVCSDNGTVGGVHSPEHSPSLSAYSGGIYDELRFKGTVYQGGINVPLVIWGGAETGIARGVVSEALCEATDLHATIADAFGLLASMDPLVDGVSLWPILRGEAPEVRSHAFAQFHLPNGGTPVTYTHRGSAVINESRWKLIDTDGVEELYDLGADRFELDDRMDHIDHPGEAQFQYLDLRARLDSILAGTQSEP